MKLPENDIKTESHGVVSTTEFGISEDDIGLILDILRTKIYKNPVLAVCREISCNARDAHREVDGDASNPTTAQTPVEIYLPNAMEPTLKIKDFGPGISPARKDIFLKFGASTKRGSNLETGGFGLGCKTPFAYGQSFTVDTVAEAPVPWKAGHMRFVYNTYIDKSKKGVMDLMLMEPTDEPLQTSIIVPVKAGDYNKFANTLIACTKHWSVRPTLFGGDPDYRPEYPVFKETFRGTNWVMYSEGVTYPCAIVDGIEYPIDRYSVSGQTDLQREMLYHGFCMEFGVGELTLTANRDHLHYDDATIKKILDRVNDISAEIKSKVIESVTKASSYFEACSIYRVLRNSIEDIMKKLGPLTWNGQKLRVACAVKDIGKWTRVVNYSLRHGDVTVDRSVNKIHFNNNEYMLIHNDQTSHINKHVVSWLLDKYPDANTIQAIYTPDKPTSAAFKEALERGTIKDGDTCEYDSELLALLEPVLYSSLQIPKTKYLRKASGDTSARDLLEDGNINGYNIIRCNGRRKYKSYYSIKGVTAQFPRSDGGVYVVYDYKTKSFLNETKEFGYNEHCVAKKALGEDIIALSEKRAGMIAGNPNWITVEEAMRNKFAPYEAEMSGATLKQLCVDSNYTHKHVARWNLEEKLDDIEDDSSPIIQWINESNAIMAEIEKFRAAFPLYEWFGHMLPGVCSGSWHDSDSEFSKLPELIEERYPLWKYMSGACPLDNIIEYVNMVDKKSAESMSVIDGVLLGLATPAVVAVSN